MNCRRRLGHTALLSLAASLAAAQQAPSAGGQAASPAPRYRVENEGGFQRDRDDYREQLLFGGLRITVPDLDLEIRAENALLLLDVETAHALAAERRPDGLPRRGIELPAPRRRLGADELRERLHRTLQALGQADLQPRSGNEDRRLDLVRYFYCEGGVTVVRGGLEVIRCDRLWISPLDDRIVVENAELRYRSGGPPGADQLVVRGARLEKSGTRWTGRDLTLTTCTAGAPHTALAVGEAEIRERPGEFEVFSRGQRLQLGGVDVLPLPDAHFFTGSQGQFPIKRVSTGYSKREGADLEVVFGLPWNTTGGALHHAITGRPANEFRGDWELGVGWIQERGFPLGGALEYRVPGLYEGRTEGFWLDDQGEDIREIRTHLDGSPIDAESRGLLRSRNRVHLGADTHLDLQAFTASDPAVLPEFFGGDYRGAELPETSLYLHHGQANHLVTIGTRHNLDSFSYRDDRALAERFVEEQPVITWNWLAQPLLDTPWGSPIVLDTATDLGERRSNRDDRAIGSIADRTLRADQLLELSAPFQLGWLNLRPYANTRATYYDETADRDHEGRVAFEAGIHLGTRFSRTWNWTDDEGSHGVRHVVAPRIGFADRFRVDDEAGEFHQFDAIDALDESNLVRFEVRNLIQTAAGEGPWRTPHDLLLLDLAQDLWPNSGRDNGGESLGLFYYDLLVSPRGPWFGFDTVGFGLYGDHDWQNGLRTLDAELRFGPLAGLTWTAEYRTDELVDGAVGLSASTRLLGRWDLYVSSLYDLDQDDVLTYGFGVRRNDHDWSVALTGGYDPFTDETSVRLEFQPRFGSFSRNGDRFGRSRLQDVDFLTP